MPESLHILHIYNPETEFALASASPFYTPPRSVTLLRSALTPGVISSFADVHDFALLLDPQPHILSIDRLNEVLSQTIDYENFNFSENLDSFRNFKFIASPWGWNFQIAQLLSSLNLDIKGIPSNEWLVNLRNLAHRKTTITFLRNLPSRLTRHIQLPELFTQPYHVVERYLHEKRLFIKAPWSSSGRGVMRTDDLQLKHVEPWVRGIIRSQGAVIVEPIYNKLLDFATEWHKIEDDVQFVGVSVFETSNRGKYHGQISASQQVLMDMIREVTPNFDDNFIYSQKEAIVKTLTGYSGPLGIDMLVTDEGLIHPCIEINLRRTMGMNIKD